MADHNEAMRLAEWMQSAVQTHPQMSEDEPGGYCTEVDQVMDQAAALLRKQAERIAELERDYTIAFEIGAQYAAERDTLRAEVERLRVDAERYQWLRAAHWSSAPVCCVLDPKANVRLGATCPSGDQLDAAIDTARKEAP